MIVTKKLESPMKLFVTSRNRRLVTGDGNFLNFYRQNEIFKVIKSVKL